MSSQKAGLVLRTIARGRTTIQNKCLHVTLGQRSLPPSAAALDHINNDPEEQQQQQQQQHQQHQTLREQPTRAMDDLPGPPGWPIVGNFVTYLKKENHGKIHHVQAEYHKKFGRIFREKWGTNWQVHVADPDLMEHIYRHQGQYPNRPSIQAWNLHRKVNNMPSGLVTSQGEEWYRIRSLLDKKLLSPAECTKFFKPLNRVTSDLITALERVRDRDGDEALAKGLPYECYKWGVECAGTLLFDRRLGCLEQEIKTDALEYIDAFNQMLASSMKLIVGEKVHQKLNTKLWQQHSKAWDKIFSTAKRYCQEKLEVLSAREAMAHGGESTGSCPFHTSGTQSTYLSDVIASGKLTLQEVFTNFSEIMFAAADTTSNTLCFLLYLLATNPEAQDKLYEEVDRVMNEIGPESNPVGRMAYLDAVIKETLRLYPLVTMQCRILEEDINIGGYLVPKGTMFVMNHYATCRDPRIFEDPEEFRPERWFRDARNRMRHHPFAAMPFGYGKRTCLGKRFARMELHMAIVKIMQKFQVKSIDSMPFEPILRTILTPGNQVPIRFVDR